MMLEESSKELLSPSGQYGSQFLVFRRIKDSAFTRFEELVLKSL